MTFAGLRVGSYRGIAADPPWPYAVTDRTRAEAARQYTLMSMADLEKLPVADLAHPDGAVLWCWATNRHLADGRSSALVHAWGFTPKTIVTWHKTGQPGVGRWARGDTEHAIVATIGHPPLPDVPLPSTMFEAARPSGGRSARSRSHSRKPAGALDQVELLAPAGPWVELFARQGRLGWSTWGLGHETKDQAS